MHVYGHGVNELWAKLSELCVLYGFRLLSALAILVVGKWLARLAARMLTRGFERVHVEPTLATFLRNLAYYALLVFVVITALGQLGVQTASFIAVIGAAGLTLGLALQGSLSNFAAGVLMILFRPFRVADFIEAAGTKGTVQEIQIFTTILRHPDGRTLIIPNAAVMNSTVAVGTPPA
ncbi:MAG: mechanosensitive ion channel [Candidatus Omnitrophica bacterium]|nr:mechanosensitive ion channel [Candidatus Omnitrophota bacterium]